MRCFLSPIITVTAFPAARSKWTFRRPDSSISRWPPTFGVAEAQFRLAEMILAGEGGRADVQQAKKWLNQARKHGHAGAMSIFGNLIFQEGQTTQGLAFMTAGARPLHGRRTAAGCRIAAGAGLLGREREVIAVRLFRSPHKIATGSD